LVPNRIGPSLRPLIFFPRLDSKTIFLAKTNMFLDMGLYKGHPIGIVRIFFWQPAVVLFSHTKSASASSHQSATSIFLTQQISTSHQPQPAEQSDNVQIRTEFFAIITVATHLVH